MIKIELEAVDAAGKTTAVKYLVTKATELGFSVVETREVGNPHLEFCKQMRTIILNPTHKLSGETMELIFSAMRVENDIWLNSLKKENKTDLVISDRGFFSHLAYGKHNTSNQFVTGLFEDLMAKTTSLPDVVIHLDVSPEIAKQRMINRGEVMDVIELKGTEYQKKVGESFKEYFKKYSDKVKVFTVDANQNIEGVRNQLDSILNRIIQEVR